MQRVDREVYDALRKDRDHWRKLYSRTKGELDRVTIELAEERRSRHAERNRAASIEAIFGGR